MRRVVILVFTLLVISCSAYLAYMIANEEFDSLDLLDNDEYYRVLAEENVPRSDLTSFQVTESTLILYYDAAGLVNVYTLEGEFLYGIQIQTIRNGSGNFVFQDHTLYILSRGNRMYAFREHNLIDSYLYTEAPEEFRQIESWMMQNKCHSMEDTTYYYLSESNQIAKTVPFGIMETVISLPKRNSNIHDVVMILLILIASFIHYLKHSKVNN